MWRDQRRILRQVRQVDGLLVHLTLAGPAAVWLLPFPAALLAEYGGCEPAAVAFYAAMREFAPGRRSTPCVW